MFGTLSTMKIKTMLAPLVAYLYNTGDGFDTITDTDGLGIIKIGTIQLTGGKQVGSNNTFESADKQHTYTYLTGNSVDGGDLLIDTANDNFWKRSA